MHHDIIINIYSLSDDHLQFTTEVFYLYLLVGGSLTLSSMFDTAKTATIYTKTAT